MAAPVDHVNPVDKLYFTTDQACTALEMGLDELEAWMAAGRLKFVQKSPRAKRRIWHEDLAAFGKWYREEHLVCPSTPARARPTGSTTSNVVVGDFKRRSMERMAVRESPRTGRGAKPKGRKRSLELGLISTPPNDVAD
jgi:hypothetical protein